MSADLTKYNVQAYFEQLTGLKLSFTDAGPNHFVFNMSLDYLAFTLNKHRLAVIEEMEVVRLSSENSDMRDTLDRIHDLSGAKP